MNLSYDASAFNKLVIFFKTEQGSEEIKARAFDKFQSLKEQT
jgi:hypothetical protein